jgi:hypothetical protein
MSAGTRARPEDFDELVEFAQSDVREAMAAVTSPAGDIHARAFSWRPGAIELMLLPPETFEHAAIKTAMFTQILPLLIRHQGAQLFAVSFTVFVKAHKPVSEQTDRERAALATGNLPDHWPPREKWRRREEQLLSVLAPGREDIWQAPIVRVHQKPPQLGYWGHVPRHQWQGGMFRAIAQALHPAPHSPRS